MKKYVGKRLDEGCEVYVEEDGKCYPLPLRTDVYNHSPTGFEWGYGGSGPAQTALAILCDYLGPAPSPAVCPFCGSAMREWKCQEAQCGYDGNKDDKWAVPLRLRQRFKADVIAQADKPGFTIDGEALDFWIKGTLRS